MGLIMVPGIRAIPFALDKFIIIPGDKKAQENETMKS
jgi:hypothetical protein